MTSDIRKQYDYDRACSWIEAHEDQTLAEVFGPMAMFSHTGDRLADDVKIDGGPGKLFGVPCFYPDGHEKVGKIVLMTPEQKAQFDSDLLIYGNAYATVKREGGVRCVSEVRIAP
jgi:hypothetical protein